MSNSSSFQKAIFLSLNLTHIWFWKTTLDFEKNPQHFFSATLIKFRNLSLITHLIRLLIVALSIVFFTIFRFHRELLIAFVLDSLMIFEGIYATLKINECLIKMHRFALISLFLFKVIMVWVDLFSTLILSWIFHWKAEVVIFIVLQVVFLVCDVTPAYSIYLLYQNEINDCMEESHHIIAEMSKTQVNDKDSTESPSSTHPKESPTIFEGKKNDASILNVLNYQGKEVSKLEIGPENR